MLGEPKTQRTVYVGKRHRLVQIKGINSNVCAGGCRKRIWYSEESLLSFEGQLGEKQITFLHKFGAFHFTLVMQVT